MKKRIFVSVILVIYMVTACFTAVPVHAEEIANTASYENIDLDKIKEIKNNRERLDTVKTVQISYENDSSLIQYLSKCNNLEKLVIKKATMDNLRFINDIHPNNSFVLELRMGYYNMKGLSNPSVKELEIESCYITDFAKGMNLENLERLDIQGMSGYEDIDYSRFKNLKTLSLKCVSVSDYKSFFEQLNSLEKLTFLGLEAGDITDKHTKYLKQLTNITSLDLDKCHITDISFLSSMKQLTYLKPPIDVNDLSVIKELPNLRTFYWGGYEQLSLTDDLVEYMDNNNITHEKYDKNLKQTLSDMVNDMNITSNMSVKEKIETVIDYTTKYITSHDTQYNEYRSNSLLYIVRFKAGVCSDYSYLEHALLKMIGVDTYYIAGLIPVFMSELSGGFLSDDIKYELAPHAWLMVQDEHGVWHGWDPVQIDQYVYTDVENNKFFVDTITGKKYNFWKNPYEDDPYSFEDYQDGKYNSFNYHFAKRRVVTNKIGYDDYLKQKAFRKVTVTIDTKDKIYTGKALTTTITLKDGKTTLKNGTDYTVSYKNNTNPGTATVTITGKGKYRGTITKTFKIVIGQTKGVAAKTQNTSSVTVKWTKDSAVTGYEVYMATSRNGKYKKVASIKKNSTTSYKKTGLTAGKTYYFKVRAYKTVSGKIKYGAYSSILTATTKPKAPSISKVTAGRKKATVKWKKVSGATGYQIQYATNSKFTKNKKTITVNKNKTTSKTISKLKAKKKYYVRIRAYKTIKVNGKNTKIYSSWSKAKSVTTKK